MEGTYGMLSLLPVIVVIVTAIITKRAVEPLILGTLVPFSYYICNEVLSH